MANDIPPSSSSASTLPSVSSNGQPPASSSSQTDVNRMVKGYRHAEIEKIDNVHIQAEVGWLFVQLDQVRAKLKSKADTTVDDVMNASEEIHKIRAQIETLAPGFLKRLEEVERKSKGL